MSQCLSFVSGHNQQGFYFISSFLSEISCSLRFVQKFMSVDVVAGLCDLQQAGVCRFPERDVVGCLPGTVPQSCLQGALGQQEL